MSEATGLKQQLAEILNMNKSRRHAIAHNQADIQMQQKHKLKL